MRVKGKGKHGGRTWNRRGGGELTSPVPPRNSLAARLYILLSPLQPRTQAQQGHA